MRGMCGEHAAADSSLTFTDHRLGCAAEQVLKKMLKTVEVLPISADDLHLTRSAQGTFADILQQLTQHSEPEVC